MTTPTGSFIWYELVTGDADAAAAFYGNVVGWTLGANEMPQAGMDYRMIERSDGGYAGGVLTLTDEMIGGGAKPGWLGYIYVADVDTAAAAIEADGGVVQMQPITLEGVGRFAMVADPQGATFYLMTPDSADDEAGSTVFTVDKPQTVRWNELVTPDDDAAVAFYGQHFGWGQEGAMPMGPMGDYRFLQSGETTIGAVMREGENMPQPGWSFYFGVEDIDRAARAVSDGGGRTLGEPQQIPGGEFSLHALDPQGAYLGLVGPRL